MRVGFWAISAAFLVTTRLAGLNAAPLGLPSNLEVSPVFQPFVERMWELSPTFRGQCRRLAAGTGLRVRVLVEERQEHSLSVHARSVLTRTAGNLVFAQVFLRPGLRVPELIAHEIEHILEQLDGADLKMQAGSGAVWKSIDGAFETRRAIEAGNRVARETAGGAAVKNASYRHTDRNIELIATAIQQDSDATPMSPRSSRLSGNGRFVVFTSSAKLADSDRNQFQDVYVMDLVTGLYSLESVGADGAAGNGDSLNPDITVDGRFVVFESAAGNLSTPLPPGHFHVFIRDRTESVTRLLTTTANGEPANGASGNPAISDDGTAVVFESSATDLISPDGVARRSVGIFLVQLTSGLRTRLDVPAQSVQPAGSSMSPAISADGRFVAFVSTKDLTCGAASGCSSDVRDANGVADVYLRDTTANTLTLVSRSHGGRDSDGASYDPVISGDGRFIAFVSEASNLTPASITRMAHVYLHDVVTGTTDLVSRSPRDRPANGASLRPALSYDGSRVAFQSLASNLLCDGNCRDADSDINLLWDVFVYDHSTQRITWVSTDIGDTWMDNSRAPSLDASGRLIAFASRHPVSPRDERCDEDLFVYRVR